MKTLEAIVREFVSDVNAAYGSQGQDDEEIVDSLRSEWPDLAATYIKARAALRAAEIAKEYDDD